MTDEAMIPCDHVIATLWEHIDGELDAERSKRVEAHLDICARCFPEYDFRRAYRTYLQRASSQSVPPEVRQRVFMAILEEERRGGAGPDARPEDPGALRGLLSRLFRGRSG